jgi:peptide deformylase
VIVESSGEITWEEGCLSLVNLTVEMTRFQRVLVRGWSVDQKEIEIEAEDLAAVCIQHELDHLDGTLFIDRLRGIKRDLVVRKIRKLQRAGQW